MNKTHIIKLFRNKGNTGSIVKDLDTAKKTLFSLVHRGYDGEPVICRYYDDNNNIKALLGIISYINTTGYITYYLESHEVENSIQELETEILTRIDGMDFDDDAVPHSFVTSVSETDGVISVSRGAVTSEDNTITVTDGDDGGIDLSMNIDGNTLVKGSDGTISVDSSALTQYVGENAIAISGVDSANNKTVSLTIAGNDLFLTNSSTGLYATLSMKKVTSNLNENVREAFVLTDKNGNQVGEQINIYKDASLDSVRLDDQQLVFVYNLANGTQSTVYVDVSNFLAESEFSEGLQVSNHVVSVKVDSSSESYISVSNSGIKISGIDAAIEAAANKATTVVEKDSSAKHLTLTSSTNYYGGNVYTIGESDIASASDLNAEIERAKEAEEELEDNIGNATITITQGSTTQTFTTNQSTNQTITLTDTTYSIATASKEGLVKLGSNSEQTATVNAVTSVSGRTYAVQLNSNDQMVVNVPWVDTDTTYSIATATKEGLVRLGSNTEQAAAANTVTSESGRTYAVQLNSSSQMVVNVPWTDTLKDSPESKVATSTSFGVVRLGSDTRQSTTTNSASSTSGRTYAVQLNDSSQMVVNVPWEKGMTIDEADARFLKLTGGTETGMVTFDGGIYVTGIAGTGGGIRFESSNSGELTIDYNGIRTETGLNIDFSTGGTTMYLNDDSGNTHVTIDGNDGTIAIDGKITAESISLTGGDGTKLLGDDGVSVTVGSGLSLSGGTLTGYYHTPTYTSGLDIGTGTNVSDLYVPVATSSRLGVAKLGSDTVQSASASGVTSTSGRTYAVQLNSSSQMVVNVPWVDTDTTYSTATSSVLGLVKLGTSSTMSTSGKYYPVGLNSSGQMYVNVPWTDSDTTYSEATSSSYGLVKLGSNSTISSSGDRNYPIQLTSSGQMYVNVPWTDTVGDGSGDVDLTGYATISYVDNLFDGVSGGTTYSVATSSVLGLVRLGSDTRQTVAANSVTSTSGRTYAVQLNSSNQMVVNVPWTDSGGSSSGSGGSTVSYTQSVTSGTQIGAITIDGTSTSIFVPTPSFSSTYTSATGVQIGSFSFNGSTTILYAPSAGSSVSDGNYYHTPIYSSGLSIGTGVGVSNMYVPFATSSQFGVVMLGSGLTQHVDANSVSSTEDRTYAVQLNGSSQMVVNVPWTEYSTATYSALGLVKLGSNTTQSVAANSVTATSGRTYAVQLDGNGRMVVNVPWTSSSSGSTVSFTQIQTSGTQIGTITIDGTSTSIYSPSATDVNVTNTLSTSSANVYVTGTSSSSTSTGTQLFSSGVYFIPSSGYVYANAYYETSDANLKEGVSDVSEEDMSRDITIREFSFKSDESKTRKYGVIAQELEAAGLGNLVSTGDDGIKSVDYISMLCLKNAQLENEIDELKKRIEALETKS